MKAYKLMIFAVLLPMECIAKDTDGDGLADDTELKIGTSINSKDSDGDGGSDYDEVRLKCDPTNSKHRIIKLEPWDKPKIGSPSRKGTISYDGEIVERTDFLSMNSNLYVHELVWGKQEKERKKKTRELLESSKAETAERERYLALSPKYEEIKKLRAESSQLWKLYEADKSKETLEAWNKWSKVRVTLVEMEKIEYEAMKLRVTYGPYVRKNRVEELEDKVEELEDEIDDLRDR